MELDVSNSQQVEKQGDHILVMNPRTRMTPDDALVLALWLVKVVDNETRLAEIDKAMRAV